jgi:hypothetical protein
MNQQEISKRISERWDAINLLDECILKHHRPTCLICGRRGKRLHFEILEAECVFQGGRLERYKCPDCGCVFGPRKVLELHSAVLAQDYKDLYSIYSEADSTESEIRAFRLMEPRKGGVYLNYGSGGWSRSVAMLQEEGFRVFACDPFYKGSHPNMIPMKSLEKFWFDGIYSNNVIEHFVTPVSEFAFMRSLLKRGGVMSHASPCYDYLYEFTRFHVIFYTGRSVETLARKVRLRVENRERDGEFICQLFKKSWW